jgi:hypothetical protein
VSNLAVLSLAPRQVVLSWQPSSGAQGYQIERSTGGKTWMVVGRLGGNGATSFTDATVGPAKVYFYRVRAFNNYGSAPASRAVRVTTPRLAAARPLRKKPR